MASTNRGNTLLFPVLKPNSTRFTLTRSGFDTGTRTFTIDRSQVANFIPELDTPDDLIFWRDRTNQQTNGTYRRMYVSHVSDITELTNNICEYSVAYLGMIKETKRPFLTSQTATGVFRAGFQVDEGTDGRMFESAPVVTQVRVTTTKPDPSELGTVIIPPGWPDRINPVIIDGVTIPALNAEFWSLRERDYEQCGPIYEVREQFVYDRIRA